MLYYIIKINGIYDILCALTILKFINVPFVKNLHLSMFIRPCSDNVGRFFAYWIFTYGIIRVSDCNSLISYSYYIEALFIMNECIIQSMIPSSALFVVISSLFLGVKSSTL